MPATVKIWWHDGATRDARYHPIPLINEPELGFETVDVSAVPASSGPAPKDAHLAVIESSVNLRYRVCTSGSQNAGQPEAKRLTAAGSSFVTIGVRPGLTLSLLED